MWKRRAESIQYMRGSLSIFHKLLLYGARWEEKKKELEREERQAFTIKVKKMEIFQGSQSFCQNYAKKGKLVDKKLLSLYNDSSSDEHSNEHILQEEEK
ncbi:MAG: hypothetical protein ACI4O0_05570 [Candidatus Limivicinus sp.]